MRAIVQETIKDRCSRIATGESIKLHDAVLSWGSVSSLRYLSWALYIRLTQVTMSTRMMPLNAPGTVTTVAKLLGTG